MKSARRYGETYMDDLALACHNLLNIYDIPMCWEAIWGNT